jgi:hypothetical protein
MNRVQARCDLSDAGTSPSVVDCCGSTQLSLPDTKGAYGRTTYIRN